MPLQHPGPPPEMPPHGSSDPSSPDYNPERDAWEDRVGPAEAQRIKSAWQAWAGQEGEYIKQQLGSGLDLSEVPGEGGELYRDAPEHGASQFAYWNSDAGKSELEFLRKQGLQYSIRGGHATWDPAVNAYRGERRNGVEILRDRNGNIIRDPGGNFRPDPLANAFGTGTAYGGGSPTAPPTNTPTSTNPNDRPYLNQPNQAYDRGWSRYLGHSVDPTKKRPVASGSPFGDIRQGGVTDPNNPIYGLPGRTTGYIPGLSPTQ